jgi:DNA-binding response OmpR family regulator
MHAIIVADHHGDRDYLSFILRHAGLAVATSGDLPRISATLVERPVDLIVLSAALDQTLTHDVAAVRANSRAPIFVITDPPTENGHCRILDSGADLVLSRPVSARLLSRYVWVFLRREVDVPAFVLPALELEAISLDPASRSVTMAGRETQQLTQLEFRLLYVLMTNRGQIIPTEVIVERVWGYTGEGNRELVRGLIRRLRRKIEPDPEQPHFIQNVPGVGYRFTYE